MTTRKHSIARATITTLTSTETIAALSVVKNSRFLGSLKGVITSRSVVGVDEITWAVARDALGKHLITDRVAVAITAASGAAAATDGAVNSWVGELYSQDWTHGVPDQLYIVLKTNTGTCDIVVELTIEAGD